MTISYDIPFFANTPDDTHCFQASLRMVVKYFQPEREFTWAELDQLTAKQPGLWTWPTTGLVWLQSQGYELHDIEPFDYERFVAEGSQYLISTFGPEVAHEQIAHSDIETERRLAQIFLAKVAVDTHTPDLTSIEHYLREGFLIICTVNSRSLNQRPGYTGHSVVITGFDDNSFRIHDPGLPPQANRTVTKTQFEKAWADPNDTAKNLVAVKLRSGS